jgi:hypothetical protein
MYSFTDRDLAKKAPSQWIENLSISALAIWQKSMLRGSSAS